MTRIRTTYRPFGQKPREYVDRLCGGRCYRDMVSGGVLRWFLPYPDDDLTVLYGIQPDGTTWCEAECGCYAGSHMLAYAGIPFEGVEDIPLEDFIANAQLLLGTGPDSGDGQTLSVG